MSPRLASELCTVTRANSLTTLGTSHTGAARWHPFISHGGYDGVTQMLTIFYQCPGAGSTDRLKLQEPVVTWWWLWRGLGVSVMKERRQM